MQAIGAALDRLVALPEQVQEWGTRLEARIVSAQDELTQIQGAVTELGEKVGAMQARVAEDVAALIAEIEALRQQVAEGTVDPAAIDALETQVRAIGDTVAGVDPVPPQPEPPA